MKLSSRSIKYEGNNEEIDFVVAWVDNSDPEWQKSFRLYVPQEDTEKEDVAGAHRFVDNGLFRFWFRGVEKFAPWVHRIFLVTSGQVPSWLNVNHPKLRLVRHDEIIDKKYLPTFNSSAIMLSIPKIPDLSEKFVLFNDDMYLVSKCKPSLFFRKGLPCDMGVLDVLSTKEMSLWWHNILNNLTLLNQRYKKQGSLKINKWFSPKLGLKNVYKNWSLWRYALFPGFYEPHLPNSYLKSNCLKSVDLFQNQIIDTLRHRVRAYSDITEWLYKNIQLVTNIFHPINKDKCGLFATAHSASLPRMISSGKYKYLCINDENPEGNESLFNAFEAILSDYSMFEKESLRATGPSDVF